MQGHGRAPLLLRDMAGFEEGLMVMVDAYANLRGHRNARRLAHTHHTTDDVGEQIGFPRQGRTAAPAGDLRNRASEIQVDVIGHMPIDHDARGLFDDGGIDAIQLQGTNPLPGSEAAQTQSLRIARHKRAGGDHFGDIQAIRPVFLANHTERPIRHARHRRQHHGHRHVDGAKPDRAYRLRGRMHGPLRGARIDPHPAIAAHVDDVDVAAHRRHPAQYRPPASAICTLSGQGSPPIDTGT